MAIDLEARVAAVEKSMVKHVARINAHETIILSVFAEIAMSKPDPLEYLATAKRLWTEQPSSPARRFGGVDPSYLDMISAEYDAAIADLVALWSSYVQAQVPAKSARQ